MSFVKSYNKFFYNLFCLIIGVLLISSFDGTLIFTLISFVFGLVLANVLSKLYIALSNDLGVRIPFYFMLSLTLISIGLFINYSKFTFKKLFNSNSPQ